MGGFAGREISLARKRVFRLGVFTQESKSCSHTFCSSVLSW